MIQITLISGSVVDGDEHSIAIVNGPYPNDNGPHTYIYLVPPAVLVTAEPADYIMARMPVGPHFARLTRPDASPIWINAQYVVQVRPPVWTENPPPHVVKSVVLTGPSPYHNAVMEDIATVTALLQR